MDESTVLIEQWIFDYYVNKCIESVMNPKNSSSPELDIDLNVVKGLVNGSLDPAVASNKVKAQVLLVVICYVEIQKQTDGEHRPFDDNTSGRDDVSQCSSRTTKENESVVLDCMKILVDAIELLAEMTQDKSIEIQALDCLLLTHVIILQKCIQMNHNTEEVLNNLKTLIGKRQRASDEHIYNKCATLDLKQLEVYTMAGYMKRLKYLITSIQSLLNVPFLVQMAATHLDRQWTDAEKKELEYLKQDQRPSRLSDLHQILRECGEDPDRPLDSEHFLELSQLMKKLKRDLRA